MEINYKYSKRDIIKTIFNNIFLFWKEYDIIIL